MIVKPYIDYPNMAWIIYGLIGQGCLFLWIVESKAKGGGLWC